jgi:6-pyruvoyl-tetrahydropterin synthase
LELRSVASASFDAQHRIPGYEPCTRPHGHSWIVEVEVGGELEPKSGWVRGTAQLHTAVQDWAAELHLGDLNELLPGVVTSPLGIASAALDALALRFPHIATVRVLCTDGTKGVVSRTPRQL